MMACVRVEATWLINPLVQIAREIGSTDLELLERKRDDDLLVRLSCRLKLLAVRLLRVSNFVLVEIANIDGEFGRDCALLEVLAVVRRLGREGCAFRNRQSWLLAKAERTRAHLLLHR